MRTLCWCSALAVLASACTAVEPLAAPAPEAVADRTFALAFDDDNVDASHSLDVLQSLMGVDAFILQTRLEGDQVNLDVGLGVLDGTLGQMACIETEVWGDLDFTAPEIRSDEGDELTFTVRYGVEAFPIELLDARLRGEFAVDGTALESVYIDAYWDVTAIDGLVEGDGCDMLPALGMSCGECPDGRMSCITASLDATSVVDDDSLAFDPSYSPDADPLCD